MNKIWEMMDIWWWIIALDVTLFAFEVEFDEEDDDEDDDVEFLVSIGQLVTRLLSIPGLRVRSKVANPKLVSTELDFSFALFKESKASK